MKTKNVLWIGLIGVAIVLFGCKKDKQLFQPNGDRAKVEIEERDDSFFSFDFAKEVFDLGYENTVSERYLERVQQRLGGSALQAEMANDLGIPCWSCTETEMNFASRTSLHYTPLLSNNNNSIEVEGILIGETYGPVTDLYIIDKTYFEYEEGDKSYFTGIFQFFRESVNGATPDKELYFRSRKCTPVTDNSDPEPQYVGPCECPASWECAIQEFSSDCFNAECVPGDPNNGGGGGSNNGNDNNDNNGTTFTIFDIFGNWFFGSKWFQDFWGVGGGLSGGGGGSWSSDSPLLPNGFFNQFAFDDPLLWEIAREVNNFRAKYNLYHVNSAQLLQLLNDCGYSDYTSILSLNGAGDGSGFPDCVKSILENAALYLLRNTDGLILNTDELIDVFGNLVYTTGFPETKKTTLVQYLKDLVGFSSDAETWLNSYERPMSFTVEFYKFLRSEGFSTEATTTLGSVFGFLHSKSFDESSSAAVEAIVSLLASDKLRGPYTDAERDAIVLEHFSNDPDFYIEYITQCLLLRHEYEQNNPGQECELLCEAQIALEAFWRVKSGLIHTAFDICGLAPFLGEPCDLVNGTLYIIEGDGVNASLSFAASIPFLGWPATGAKYAKIIIDSAAGAIELVVKKGAGGIIKFPLPSGVSFRQIVGVTDPLEEAHHLIPKATKDHDLVQHAASAKEKTFHLHHPKNGMAAKKYRIDYQPDGIHANHPNYNNQVRGKMDDIVDDLEFQYGLPINQIDPNIVSQRLIDFQNSLRSLIEANPNTKINDLVIP